MLLVLVKKEDFEEAENDTTIYGLLNGKSGCHVRCKLRNKKQNFVCRKGDDPNTEYKLFFNCNYIASKDKTEIQNASSDTKMGTADVQIYY